MGVRQSHEYLRIWLYILNIQKNRQIMKTPCAFHPGHTIVQFCKSSSCLLPLCTECVQIHMKQHNNLSQQIVLIPIESAVNQYKYIDTITAETINKYRESDDQHKRVFQQIIQHKQMLMHSISSTYDSIIQELQNNARRRDLWIRDFNQSVLQLKEQLNSLGNSLSGDKYLRAVIMWNRMKPNQAIEIITKKTEKKWLVPEFGGVTHEQFIKYISNNTHLKVLEIEGDSGVNKILHIIRVLRYGQNETSGKTSTGSTESANSNPMPVVGNNPPAQKQPMITIMSPTNNQMLKNVHHPMMGTPSPLTINHNIPHNNMSNNPNTNIHTVNNNSGQQIPMYFSSPNRKTSTKKLEVLSSLELKVNQHTHAQNK